MSHTSCEPASVLYKCLVVFYSTAGAENHSDCDCFGVAVLSHGDEGLLYGIDNQISIENMIAPIKNCQSLAGKPKLFFFEVGRYTVDQ